MWILLISEQSLQLCVLTVVPPEYLLRLADCGSADFEHPRYLQFPPYAQVRPSECWKLAISAYLPSQTTTTLLACILLFLPKNACAHLWFSATSVFLHRMRRTAFWIQMFVIVHGTATQFCWKLVGEVAQDQAPSKIIVEWSPLSQHTKQRIEYK